VEDIAITNPARFMEDVLSMWTNPDAEARAAILQGRFTEDVHFHDADGEFVGHAGLEEFSASLRDRFPGARFSLISAPEAVGDGFRAFWRFGPPENPDLVTGMDFVIWDGERANSLYAFVKRPPKG
jgi:hypothetical protein